MSDMVHVSHNHSDHEVLNVSVGPANIEISELRVRRIANFATPHEVLGKGGARISLTDKQLLLLVSEYLRYTIQEDVSVEKCSVGNKFIFEKTKT